MTEKQYLSFSHLSLEDLTPFEKSQLSAYNFAKNLDQAVSISSLIDAYADAGSEEESFLDLAYQAFLKESQLSKISH